MIAMKKTRSSNALSSISMIASLVLLLSSLLLLSTASAGWNLRLLVGSNRHGSNEHGNAAASDGMLSLDEFQSLLRTSVDDELERIVGKQVKNDNNAVYSKRSVSIVHRLLIIKSITKRRVCHRRDLQQY